MRNAQAGPQHNPLKGIWTMNTGTVKFYNETKGFGFIQPDAGGADVFVHATALERAGMGRWPKARRSPSRPNSTSVRARPRSARSSAPRRPSGPSGRDGHTNGGALAPPFFFVSKGGDRKEEGPLPGEKAVLAPVGDFRGTPRQESGLGVCRGPARGNAGRHPLSGSLYAARARPDHPRRRKSPTSASCPPRP